MAALPELHFVMVPQAEQGHIIPMVDVARLIAARGPRVTFITTPVNAARNRATVDGARRAGLPLELVELPLSGPQHGLPEGIETMDQLTGQELGMYIRFFQAIWNLAGPLEEYIRTLSRLPVCLVADFCGSDGDGGRHDICTGDRRWSGNTVDSNAWNRCPTKGSSLRSQSWSKAMTTLATSQAAL